jgi:hypothetical protein
MPPHFYLSLLQHQQWGSSVCNSHTTLFLLIHPLSIGGILSKIMGQLITHMLLPHLTLFTPVVRGFFLVSLTMMEMACIPCTTLFYFFYPPQ